MTTYAFIGDPHVGNFTRHGGIKKLGMNRRCELSLHALQDALKIAHTEKAAYAVILGDLFDSMKPEPQLLDAVRQTFRAYAKRMQIILLKGNHDSASDEPRDTALYAVIEPHVIVVDQPRVLSSADPYGKTQGAWTHCNPPLVLVPFRSGPVIEWLPDLLESLKPPQGSILCLHAGIKDQATAPWLQGAPDAIEMKALDSLMDQFAIELVFAGNWHEHQVWDHQQIFQVGALCPTGFSNLGGSELYGNVMIVRPGKEWPDVTRHSVPGPRFYKVGPTESPMNYVKPGSDEHVYIEWKVPPDAFQEARTYLNELIAAGHIEAGSVVPDTAGASAGLKRAAQAAKSAVGISEAVAAFVSKLQLPPHADRDSVHARIRAYTGLE